MKNLYYREWKGKLAKGVRVGCPEGVQSKSGLVPMGACLWSEGSSLLFSNRYLHHPGLTTASHNVSPKLSDSCQHLEYSNVWENFIGYKRVEAKRV